MLSDQERNMLKSVARTAGHPELGKTNYRLDDMVKGIKLLNPKAFLQADDLANRRFFHKPTIVIPYKSFERERV